MTGARYAIYFAPPADTSLARLAATWLGRDAVSGDAIRQPDVPGLSRRRLAELTDAPRHYGFHGTLRSPFRIADDAVPGALADGVAELAAHLAPVTIPAIRLDLVSGYFALVPDRPSGNLASLAAACVEMADRYRSALNDDELARRRRKLSERQEALLMRWGYPFVLDEFHFHMTLTKRVAPPDIGILQAALTDHFKPILGAPLRIDALSLFHQPSPESPFLRVRHFPLNDRALVRARSLSNGGIAS